MLPQFRLVFLLRVLLIEDAVFLLPHIHAEDAVAASDAIEEERRVAAVRAITGPAKVLTDVAIINIETSAAFMGKRNIAAILAFLQPVAV